MLGGIGQSPSMADRSGNPSTINNYVRAASAISPLFAAEGLFLASDHGFGSLRTSLALTVLIYVVGTAALVLVGVVLIGALFGLPLARRQNRKDRKDLDELAG